LPDFLARARKCNGLDRLDEARPFVRIKPIATCFLQSLFHLFRIEAGFRYELARDHFAYQRRPSAEHANVANTWHGLYHLLYA
jgi:hypothetical protein